MAIKDAEIKVRLTKDQKELFKRVAKDEGMSMSEFIVVTTENMARKKEGNIKSKKMIEDRAMGTEKKSLDSRMPLKVDTYYPHCGKKNNFGFYVFFCNLYVNMLYLL